MFVVRCARARVSDELPKLTEILAIPLVIYLLWARALGNGEYWLFCDLIGRRLAPILMTGVVLSRPTRPNQRLNGILITTGMMPTPIESRSAIIASL
jgi:hypothetical protein